MNVSEIDEKPISLARLLYCSMNDRTQYGAGSRNGEADY